MHAHHICGADAAGGSSRRLSVLPVVTPVHEAHSSAQSLTLGPCSPTQIRGFSQFRGERLFLVSPRTRASTSCGAGAEGNCQARHGHSPTRGHIRCKRACLCPAHASNTTRSATATAILQQHLPEGTTTSLQQHLPVVRLTTRHLPTPAGQPRASTSTGGPLLAFAAARRGHAGGA